MSNTGEQSSSMFSSYRPTSTIARSFSDQLNDAFLIDDNLDKLTSTVEEKKQSVTFQSHELKLLEESIRRAEALLEEKKNRLSKQFPASAPPNDASPVSPTSPRRTRQPLPNYDSNGSENSVEKGNENGPPKRAAPKPPGTEGYVVVQKTPSMLSAAEERRMFEEQYKGRPPPPVPTGS